MYRCLCLCRSVNFAACSSILQLLRGHKRFNVIETQKAGLKFTDRKLSQLNEGRHFVRFCRRITRYCCWRLTHYLMFCLHLEYAAHYQTYLDIQEEVAKKVIGEWRLAEEKFVFVDFDHDRLSVAGS